MRKLALGLSCIFVFLSAAAQAAIHQGDAYYQFGSTVKTVGQAVQQLAKDNHLKINASCLGKTLTQSLPETQRMFGPVNLYVALKMLTGTSAFVVNPAAHEIVFQCSAVNQVEPITEKPHEMSHHVVMRHSPMSHVETHPLVQHVAAPYHLTPLQQYMQIKGYHVRVAWPLIQEGLSASGVKSEVKIFDRSHTLYFAFNHLNQIVAIAPTQSQANALAQQKRHVFYVSAGETLQTVINRWASYEGIKVYWLAKYDVRINQPSVFYGQFGGKSGPLVQILHAVAAENVNLRVVFHDNHVLTVKADDFSTALL